MNLINVSFSLSTESHPKYYLGIIQIQKYRCYFLCFTFTIFSFPWYPLQFLQAGEKCLMFIQRLKILGENHPPLLPWWITAQQHGASRPAAAAGGTSPPKPPCRSGEPARPLPPQPCANQVSPAFCRPDSAVLKRVSVLFRGMFFTEV